MRPGLRSRVNCYSGCDMILLLLRLRHDSLPATARRTILPLQLPRIAVDADPFAVLQDEARNRPVGVDRRLCNGMNESEGQEPQ